MSFAKMEEIKCHCGEIFEAELWSAINASDDPDIKESLVSGEVNVVCCPACGQMFYAENFILYHDSQNEIIAFIYPVSFASQTEQCSAMMKKNFITATVDTGGKAIIDYEPMLFFGLDDLIKIIREDEEAADETAVLKYCAKDLGLELITLKPSLARRLQLPRIIPMIPSNEHNIREAILAGLSHLLRYNENLSIYERLLRNIESNKQWKLDKKLIKIGV